MQKNSIKDIIKNPKIDQIISVNGWVRNKRGSKNVSFISVNDGSTILNLQIVAESKSISEEILKKINTGA
jgi:asparaginyl-tRNA synthetase